VLTVVVVVSEVNNLTGAVEIAAAVLGASNSAEVVAVIVVVVLDRNLAVVAVQYCRFVVTVNN